MCAARPGRGSDGRGVGVTETPLIASDLPATPVMEAKLGKCGHCAWTSLREHSISMGRKLHVTHGDRSDADRC